jgi:hypothetical protein
LVGFTPVAATSVWDGEEGPVKSRAGPSDLVGQGKPPTSGGAERGLCGMCGSNRTPCYDETRSSTYTSGQLLTQLQHLSPELGEWTRPTDEDARRGSGARLWLATRTNAERPPNRQKQERKCRKCISSYANKKGVECTSRHDGEEGAGARVLAAELLKVFGILGRHDYHTAPPPNARQ